MKLEYKCNNCGRVFMTDTRNLKRGWGKCCSKSCAASLRERNRPGYNPQLVVRNNIRRANWWEDRNTGIPVSFGDYPGADFDQWGDMDLGIHE